MLRTLAIAAALMMVTACSDSEADQAAIDAAVEKALAERDREDAAKYRALEAKGDAGEASSDKDAAKDDAETKPASFSTENLREGVPDGMGTPYGMCIRTLSIVGEHCGCMVNRAMDAGIPNNALVRLFGGDGSRATENQSTKFTRIVRSCSGYNITVQRAGSAVAKSDTEAPKRTTSKGRRVQCSFDNTVFSYNGACNFVTGPGGDFETTSLDGPYFQNVTKIDLDVTGKGRGTIALRYPDGDDVFVQVTRSPRDRACWDGPKLTFCAR